MTTKQPRKPGKKSQISNEADKKLGKKPESKVEFDLSDEELEKVSGGGRGVPSSV